MELVTCVGKNDLIHLTAPEFAALMPSGGPADILFEAAFGMRLGRAPELKSVGAVWLAIRHDALPENESGSFQYAIKQAFEGMLTGQHLVSWVPFDEAEQRAFVFFGPTVATVVSISDEGLLRIGRSDNRAAIDDFANTVKESKSLRFVVTATDLFGKARVMAWQADMFSDRYDGAVGVEADVSRHDAARRVAQKLDVIVGDGNRVLL